MEIPTADVNGISINYILEGSGSGDIIVLVNGLADDIATWDAQVPAYLEAGYRVLRYDNRGIGKTSKPPGPYTAELMADDLHALLVDRKINQFHLLGISMGGMISQSYALKYPNGSGSGPQMLSLSLCCTYAQPTTFCSRMFSLWEDMSQRMSVQEVMRDVTLWAFTVPFFRDRPSELAEVEAAMRDLDMPVDAYLSQLNVIQKFDTTKQLEELKQQGNVLGNLSKGKVLVLAGEEDILIPVVLSRELAHSIEEAQFLTSRGGHGCCVSSPRSASATIRLTIRNSGSSQMSSIKSLCSFSVSSVNELPEHCCDATIVLVTCRSCNQPDIAISLLAALI